MKRSGYFEEVTLDEFIFRCSVVNLVFRNSLVTKEKRTKFRLNLMDSPVISCTQQNTRTIIMNKSILVVIKLLKFFLIQIQSKEEWNMRENQKNIICGLRSTQQVMRWLAIRFMLHKQEKWWILAIKLHSHCDDHIHFNILFYLLGWLNLV